MAFRTRDAAAAYDHLLARHWDRFAEQSLTDFTARMYEAVLDQQALMPERARMVLVRMAEEDWLGSYAQLANLHQALDNMARRLRPGNPLPGAVDELERRMIVASLERNHWNKTRAAAELEVSRRNLIRLVQKYGLEAGRGL